MHISKKLLAIFLIISSTLHAMEVQVTNKSLVKMTIPEISKNFSQSNGDADLLIGKKFYFGLGIPKNYDVAFKQFVKSAQKDNIEALLLLSEMITSQEGNVKDFPKDISWLKKLADKDNINTLAARRLLELIITDPAVPQDLKKNIENYFETQPRFLELLKIKSSQGDPFAKVLLKKVQLIESNPPKNLPETYIKALKAEADKGDVAAANKLAFHYYYGQHMDQNFSEAFKYAHSAAQKNSAPALYMLSMMYRKGKGVTRNDKKAFDSMQASAQLGFVPAQSDLGEMYINGVGIDRNFPEALLWIKKAADNGNANAYVKLGTLALFGIGDSMEDIEPHYEQAFEFFGKAAALGNFVGMYELAQLYQSGLAGEKA